MRKHPRRSSTDNNISNLESPFKVNLHIFDCLVFNLLKVRRPPMIVISIANGPFKRRGVCFQRQQLNIPSPLGFCLYSSSDSVSLDGRENSALDYFKRGNFLHGWFMSGSRKYSLIPSRKRAIKCRLWGRCKRFASIFD